MSEDLNGLSGWDSVSILSLADYLNGYPFKPHQLGNNGTPVIRIEQLREPEGFFDYHAGELGDRFVIEDGDLIFSWSATLMARIWKHGHAYLNQHLFKVLPNEKMDKQLLLYLLNGNVDRMALSSQGSTMRHITRKDLGKFMVLVPQSKDTQRTIARILGTVDALIEQTEALIEKQQQIKQGMLHDLFTRGVDANGQLRTPQSEAPEFYKETEIGCIPIEWRVERLDDLADVDRGKFTHRPRNDVRFYIGPYPFIQTGDVAESVGRFLSEASQSLNERGLGVSKEFPANTIAITVAANIADTAILSVPMCFPDSVVGVVVKEPNNTRFIELALRRSKPELEARAPQSAQKNINLMDLRPLLVPTPEVSEQCAIALRYESMEELIQQLQSELDKLQFLKSGLMQDLLTGRVSVDHLVEAKEVGGATIINHD